MPTVRQNIAYLYADHVRPRRKAIRRVALAALSILAAAAVLKTVELRGSGGSNPSLSANDREVGWVANDIRLQPFCFSEATNLFGTFRDRP